MTTVLGEKESIAIRYMRVLAMCSIVSCHFMQALDNHWAWVFNIGVQVFLLISGFLYGHKHVDNWLQWYRKRFVRIYIPFILFFVAIVPLYTVTERITIKNIVVYIADMQGIWGGVKGLGHLWFLTAIAFCYAITPFLQWTRKYSRLLIWLAIAVMAVILLRFPGYCYRCFVALPLYAFGYYLALIGRYGRWTLGAMAVGVLIWLMTMFSWEKMMLMSGNWSMAFHNAGAIFIFLWGLKLITVLKAQKVVWPVKKLDKYSFQIYIVHHILIMKPFGMLWLTDSVTMNIVVILSYIPFYTWVLCKCEEKVETMLEKIKTKSI